MNKRVSRINDQTHAEVQLYEEIPEGGNLVSPSSALFSLLFLQHWGGRPSERLPVTSAGSSVSLLVFSGSA